MIKDAVKTLRTQKLKTTYIAKHADELDQKLNSDEIKIVEQLLKLGERYTSIEDDLNTFIPRLVADKEMLPLFHTPISKIYNDSSTKYQRGEYGELSSFGNNTQNYVMDTILKHIWAFFITENRQGDNSYRLEFDSNLLYLLYRNAIKVNRTLGIKCIKTFEPYIDSFKFILFVAVYLGCKNIDANALEDFKISNFEKRLRHKQDTQNPIVIKSIDIKDHLNSLLHELILNLTTNIEACAKLNLDYKTVSVFKLISPREYFNSIVKLSDVVANTLVLSDLKNYFLNYDIYKSSLTFKLKHVTSPTKQGINFLNTTSQLNTTVGTQADFVEDVILKLILNISCPRKIVTTVYDNAVSNLAHQRQQGDTSYLILPKYQDTHHPSSISSMNSILERIYDMVALDRSSNPELFDSLWKAINFDAIFVEIGKYSNIGFQHNKGKEFTKFCNAYLPKLQTLVGFTMFFENVKHLNQGDLPNFATINKFKEHYNTFMTQGKKINYLISLDVDMLKIHASMVRSMNQMLSLKLPYMSNTQKLYIMLHQFYINVKINENHYTFCQLKFS